QALKARQLAIAGAIARVVAIGEVVQAPRVRFAIPDHLPGRAYDRGHVALDLRVGDQLDEDGTSWRRLPAQCGRERYAVHAARAWDAGEVEQRRHNVDEADRCIDDPRRDAGRVHEQRNAHDLVVEAARVKANPVLAELVAMIRGDDHDGRRIERGEHTRDVL